jgi:hypothetical protein
VILPQDCNIWPAYYDSLLSISLYLAFFIIYFIFYIDFLGFYVFVYCTSAASQRPAHGTVLLEVMTKFSGGWIQTQACCIMCATTEERWAKIL